MQLTTIKPDDPSYPPGLAAAGIGLAQQTLQAWGNADVLKGEKVALFCSARCAGDLILKAYDLAKKLRDDGVTVISGFHSPVEKECLRILLLSPFSAKDRRVSADLARRRNEFVAAIADRVCLIHVSPGGELEALRDLVRERRKALLVDNVLGSDGD